MIKLPSLAALLGLLAIALPVRANGKVEVFKFQRLSVNQPIQGKKHLVRLDGSKHAHRLAIDSEGKHVQLEPAEFDRLAQHFHLAIGQQQRQSHGRGVGLVVKTSRGPGGSSAEGFMTSVVAHASGFIDSPGVSDLEPYRPIPFMKLK
jgi:hypothetical protein